MPNKGNDGLAGHRQNPACEVITQKSPKIHDKLCLKFQEQERAAVSQMHSYYERGREGKTYRN